MPVKREIDVYQFDELPAKAKQRAIEAYREHAWDEHDTEVLSDAFRERLESLGLPSDKVQWRLSSSQGDGVAFYGKFDIEDYLKANKLMKEFSALRALDPLPYAEITKIGPHMYDHWNTMRVSLEPQTDLTAKQEALLSDLEAQIAQHIQVVSRELEKIGYDEIEYRTGDEAIAETLQINEYEYDARGDRI
jgi:hypothetical protein